MNTPNEWNHHKWRAIIILVWTLKQTCRWAQFRTFRKIAPETNIFSMNLFPFCLSILRAPNQYRMKIMFIFGLFHGKFWKETENETKNFTFRYCRNRNNSKHFKFSTEMLPFTSKKESLLFHCWNSNIKYTRNLIRSLMDEVH